MEAIKTEKQQMRKEFAAFAKQVPPNDVVEESNNVTEKVLASEWIQNAKKVSVYVSTVGEIETSALIKALLAQNKHVYIPHFQKGSNSMDMYQLKNLDEYNNLDPTLWGIKQHANPSEEMSWRKSGGLDVILMPGVAFTRDGRRLGHGKGFYDRFLHEHERLFGRMPVKVALALHYQLIENVPTSEYDVPVDRVLIS